MADVVPGSSPMRRALAWSVPNGRRRTSAAAALLAAAIVIVSALVSRPLLRRIDTGKIGGVTGVQLDSAAQWVLCGRLGRIAKPNPHVDLIEVTDAASYDRSVLDLIGRGVGGTSAYCALPALPIVVEEGMMLIDALFVRLAPRASLKGLALACAIGRLFLIGIFAFFVIRVGYSIPFSALIVGAAVYLTLLLGGNLLYSAYPFVMPMVLAGIGIAGLTLMSPSPWALPASCFGLGVWAAFLGTLRTSNYPTGVLLIGLLIAWAAASWKHKAVAAVAAVIGLVLFDQVLIAPIRASVGNENLSHTLAHNLVLGLSLPPNDLSRREGIAWDDSVGLVLAARVSDVNFKKLGMATPAYDAALFTYYRGLWRAYPREMVRIYLRKLTATGERMFAWLAVPEGDLFWESKNARFLTVCAALVRPASAVLTLGGVMLLLVAAGGLLRGRRGPAYSWLVFAVGAAGAVSFLEAAIILGSVVLWYNGVIIFATLFAGLLIYEIALSELVSWRAPRPLI